MSYILMDTHSNGIDAHDHFQSLVTQARNLVNTNRSEASVLAHKALDFAAARGKTQGLQVALTIIADRHTVDHNISKATYYLNQAEPQAISAGDWQCQAWIHRLRNMLAHSALDWKQSFFHIRRSIELYQENDAFDSLGQRALGRHYIEAGLFPEALEVLHQVLDSIPQNEQPLTHATTCGTLAMLYYEMQNFERFAEANQTCLDIATSIQNDTTRALCLERRACAALVGSVKTSADPIADLEESIAIHRNNGDTHYLIQGLFNYASALLLIGNQTKGQKYLDESTNLARKLDIPKLLIVCLISQSEEFIKQARYQEACSLLQESLALAEKGGLQSRMVPIYRHLADVSEKLEDTRNSLRYTKKLMELQHSMFGAQAQRKIAAIENRFDMQQAKIRQEMLQLQNNKLSGKVEQLNQELAKMANVLAQRNAAIAAIERQASEQAESNTVELEDKKSSLHSQIQSSLQTEPSWNDFEQLFASVHGEFIQCISHLHHDLTPTEIKVCILLKLNMSSQQVAETLFLSRHTVNTHRQKVRRKLQLSKGQNLVTYLQQVSQ